MKQFLLLLLLALPAGAQVTGLRQGGTGQSSWVAGRCVRVADDGTKMESAAADCGSGGGGSSFYQTVLNAASALSQRATINFFNGIICSDNSGSARTDCRPNYGTTANTVAEGSDSRITGAEQTSNKNAASGYAGLSAGSKIAASQIPLPTASTLGGVESKTCTGTDKFSALGTDGILVCTADQSVTGGTGVISINGATQSAQTIAGGTNISVSTDTGTGATTVATSGLGNAATKNTGTIAGTVMAGDDSRVTSLGTAATHASTDFAASNAATTVNGQSCVLGSGCTVTSATITGALALANTPLTARGDLLIATTATPILGKLAKGSQYQTLQGGATDPGFDAVHLDQASAVTGALPWANQAHTAANVVGIFNSGTCSGYLKSDGTCDVPTGSGSGTVTVVGAGSLANAALTTGGGTTTIQTPSGTTTLDASGNLSLAASGSIGSANTGTPKFTFATSKVTVNQPFYLGTTTNQLVTGTTTNLTTLNFPASSGAVTLTFPNTTANMLSAAASLTSTALVTAAGATALQTPSASATMDASGNISTPGTVTPANLTVAAGGSVGSSNTGTPKFTFATNSIGANQTINFAAGKGISSSNTGSPSILFGTNKITFSKPIVRDGSLATGLLKNTITTGVESIAVASDVVNIFGSGACSGYLKSDGTCDSGGGGTVTKNGNLTTKSVMIGGTNGTTDVTADTGCSTDGAGAQTCTSFSTSGSAGGTLYLSQGTIAAIGTTSFGLTTPTSVTSYNWTVPASENASAGVLHVGAAATHVSALTVSQIVPADLAGNSSTGHGMCWKDATHVGYCSTALDASGLCTCN